DNCLKILSRETFNPFSKDVKFDILANRYEGDSSYIEMFQLDKRCDSLLEKLEETIYNYVTTDNNMGYLDYLKNLFPSTLENEYILFLSSLNIINNLGTINLKKLNNLIRTRNLLKNIY
ncbi:MAG: hypothetical protein ACRC5T_05495, partial [Cetobacterium sp.]